MGSNKAVIQFRVMDDWLQGNLQGRDPQGAVNPGITARKHLMRWFQALEDALLGVVLEAAEILVLVDVVAEWDATGSMEMLVDEFPEAIEANETPGYGHVRQELAEQARKWSEIQRWAVVDYIERYIVAERLHGGALPDVVDRINRMGHRA